jgi:hypothetical protein
MRVAILLLLVGCKTSHSLDVQQEAHSTEGLAVEQTVQTGPETITTTVEEFETGGLPAGDGAAPKSAKPLTQQPPTLPHAPVLVKRTVTVDQRAPAVAETHIEANGSLEEKSGLKKEDKAAPAAGCMLGLGFWGAIAIAAVLGVAVLYLKLRPLP